MWILVAWMFFGVEQYSVSQFWKYFGIVSRLKNCWRPKMWLRPGHLYNRPHLMKSLYYDMIGVRSSGIRSAPSVCGASHSGCPRGRSHPCKTFCHPWKNLFGHSLKLLDTLWKIWAPFRKLFDTPGVPSRLRTWRDVKKLYLPCWQLHKLDLPLQWRVTDMETVDIKNFWWRRELRFGCTQITLGQTFMTTCCFELFYSYKF